MTAREIALDIGLAANQAPRIFELCKRCDIQLAGRAAATGSRRRPHLSRLSAERGLSEAACGATLA
ncbi:hypothetical protein [Bradyrhizobium sp. NBAIM01]|uniref:hypothetical protein n=1 Tax=Bradyrhizobium sp. NBAIM01 TaxID=2793818 RepID=UPI001CD37BE6|nr:hypothetical protein [Bradyrhizobium sp. NBAIM01]MCA1510506.1 hypothetical protein [Bradyrhizobium sp. NBAIM01]